MTKAIRLKDFLPGINVAVAKSPPLIHSTSAHRLLEILDSGKLLAMPCNVFAGDKLCYCFVGRPAYKVPSIESPSEWQLPIAFVLRFDTPPVIKRVFPFDSGAFRGGRFPSYISCFELDGYELSGDPNNIGRLISFFFKSTERYVGRRAADHEELKDEHCLDMRHQEVLAVGRLFRENSSSVCDDRAAAVEIQIAENITLARENLLGVVIPDEYKRTPGLMSSLKSIAGVIQTYPHLPLGTREHYGLIYDGVNKIYKKAGIKL
jgi:hypothetical protein